MFFKPYKGICRCHNKERWILNKKGECNETIIGKRKRRNDVNGSNGTERNGDKRFIKRSISKDAKHFRSKNNLYWKQKSVLKRIPGSFIQKKPIAKKVKKATGEAVLFLQIWHEAIEEAAPSCPTCRVCKAPLGYEPKTYYFSHVLAKSTYPSLRTYKPNIWLECLDCHTGWDQGDRSLPKFAEKREVAEYLKRLYYLKQIP